MTSVRSAILALTFLATGCSLLDQLTPPQRRGEWHLQSYDLRTGRVAWDKSDVDDIAYLDGDKTCILASSLETVQGLDPKTGRSMWTNRSLSLDSDEDHLVHDGAVFCHLQDAANGTRIRLDGKQVWTTPGRLSAPRGSAALFCSQLYIGGRDALRAVDLKTGKSVWKRPVPRLAALAANAKVCITIAPDDEVLEGRDMRTGEAVWKMPFPKDFEPRRGRFFGEDLLLCSDQAWLRYDVRRRRVVWRTFYPGGVTETACETRFGKSICAVGFGTSKGAAVQFSWKTGKLEHGLDLAQPVERGAFVRFASSDTLIYKDTAQHLQQVTLPTGRAKDLGEHGAATLLDQNTLVSMLWRPE